MTIVKSYQDLLVWQKARILVSDVYILTQTFPQDERFGLTSQLRRAIISVPSNIAEGSSKRSTKEFLRFLNIAYGSLAEVETQLFLAQDLGYLLEAQTNPLLEKSSQIGRMLNALMNKLEHKITELRTPNSEFSDAKA